MRALQHYTDLSDIKRCVVNTHGIDPAALVEFFGHISREWALDCLKELLGHNMRGNLQLVVTICKEYTEQLTAESIIAVFESFKSYEGLFFYLGSYISFSQDPAIHFKVRKRRCVGGRASGENDAAPRVEVALFACASP